MPRSPLRTQRPSRSHGLKPATWVAVKPRRPASCAIGVLCMLYEWNAARARSHARQPSEPSRLLTTGTDGVPAVRATGGGSDA
jgi:hypothetical protein